MTRRWLFDRTANSDEEQLTRWPQSTFTKSAVDVAERATRE
jgi:hypothetical protein